MVVKESLITTVHGAIEGKVQLPQAVHDRYLIVDEDVWLLGASVKDMGRGLCTIIKLSFTPDEILSRV